MKKIEIVEHVINNTTISRSQAIQAVDCVFLMLSKIHSVEVRVFISVALPQLKHTPPKERKHGILVREQQLLFQLNALPSSSLVNNLKLE